MSGWSGKGSLTDLGYLVHEFDASSGPSRSVLLLHQEVLAHSRCGFYCATRIESNGQCGAGQLVGTGGASGAEEGSCDGCWVGGSVGLFGGTGRGGCVVGLSGGGAGSGNCGVGVSDGTGRGGCGGGTIVMGGSGLVDGSVSGGSVRVVVGSGGGEVGSSSGG